MQIIDNSKLSPLQRERGPLFEQIGILFAQYSCFVPSVVDIGFGSFGEEDENVKSLQRRRTNFDKEGSLKPLAQVS